MAFSRSMIRNRELVMAQVTEDFLRHLLDRLRQVQLSLLMDAADEADVDAPLAEQLDSMGLVEYIAWLAQDCAVGSEIIERYVQSKTVTLRDLAEALPQAGLEWNAEARQSIPQSVDSSEIAIKGWLSAARLGLPNTIQTAEHIDSLLQRPSGWFAQHTGIQQRHLWEQEDPLTVTTETARLCLTDAGVLPEEVGALLVSSEAPPVPVGMAATLHHRLELHPDTVALDVGGACTGFLAALWLSQYLLAQAGNILIVAVEAPSRYFNVRPGPSGEAASLFGDGCAACVVSEQPLSATTWPIVDVATTAHGDMAELLQVTCSNGRADIHINGPALANAAIRTMAQNVREMLDKHHLTIEQIAAVIPHAGNARMPALLAKQLHLAPERVLSVALQTGNLGAASLLAPFAMHGAELAGPMVWTAVGAGMTSACALTGTTSPMGKQTLPF